MIADAPALSGYFGFAAGIGLIAGIIGAIVGCAIAHPGYDDPSDDLLGWIISGIIGFLVGAGVIAAITFVHYHLAWADYHRSLIR